MTTSGSRLRACIYVGFLVLTLAVPGVLWAQTFVSGDEVRAACRALASTQRQEGEPDSKVAAFCKLGAPVDGNWAQALVPTSADLKSVANKHRGGNPFDMLTIGADMSAGLGQTQAIVTGEQFIVNRASRELNASIVTKYANLLCSRVVTTPKEVLGDGKEAVMLPPNVIPISHFMASTCTLLQGGSGKPTPSALPAWSVVRASLRRDLTAAPDSIVAQVKRYATSALKGQQTKPDARRLAEFTATLSGAVRFANSYLQTRDVAQSFRVASTEVWRVIDGLRGSTTWKDYELATAVVAVGGVGGSVGIETINSAISDDSQAEADTAALYAEKALAMNALGTDATTCADANNPVSQALKIRFPASAPCDGKRRFVFDAAKVWVVDSAVIAAIRIAQTQIREASNAGGADRKIAYANALIDLLPSFALAVDQADEPGVARLISLGRQYGRIQAAKLNERYADLILDATLLGTAIGDAAFQRLTMPPFVARTIQFATDVADSKDADGFEAALEKAAAPIDAYSRKRIWDRSSDRNYFTVNAYAGGIAGYEWAQSPTFPKSVRANNTGLYVPIGLEIGRKEVYRNRRLLGDQGITLGLFAQLLDLGQVATWRLSTKDDSVKAAPPAFDLQHVFSPGAFVVAHGRTLPLTLGLGWSWAPRFRELALTPATNSNGTATPTKADVNRISVFLAVDVPILP